jgi:hypothetical protein
LPALDADPFVTDLEQRLASVGVESVNDDLSARGLRDVALQSQDGVV